MKPEQYYLFSFDSSHQAMAAELAVSGLAAARLIPLPPEISEGCGLSLRIPLTELPAAQTALKDIGYQAVYKLTTGGGKRTAELVK